MELRAMLERWVSAGLITAEQAEAIEAAEQQPPAPEHARPARPRTAALVAEAVGYVGAALAFVAAAIITEQFWADLQAWARTALAALAWVALFAAGAALRGSESAGAAEEGHDAVDASGPAAGAAGEGHDAVDASGPAARLASVLWTLSAASCALTLWLAGDELLELAEDITILVAGAGTALYSGWLQLRRTSSLLHVTLFTAVVTTVLSGLAVIDESLENWVGLALWGTGVAWALLAWGGVVRPVGAGYVLGAVAALLGPFLLETGTLSWPVGLVLGLLTAVALAAVSVVLRHTALLALGAVGIFLYVPAIVFEFFADTLGAPVALFVTGVVLVAAALAVGRVSGATRRGEVAK